MKIESACKQKGCTSAMYCFGGKDKTLDNTLCPEVIFILAKDVFDRCVNILPVRL